MGYCPRKGRLFHAQPAPTPRLRSAHWRGIATLSKLAKAPRISTAVNDIPPNMPGDSERLATFLHHHKSLVRGMYRRSRHRSSCLHPSGGQQHSFSSPMPVSGVRGQLIVVCFYFLCSYKQLTFYRSNRDLKSFGMTEFMPCTCRAQTPRLQTPRLLCVPDARSVSKRGSLKTPGGPAKVRAGAWGGEMSSRPPQIRTGQSVGGSGGGVTSWQDNGGIGSGLAHPGPNGSVLLRKSKWFQTDAEDASYAGSGAGKTRLSELIPRFLRLSALVAMELGQELGDDKYKRDFQGENLLSSSPIPAQPLLHARKARWESETSPLRLSRELYMLFAELLARVALER